MQIVPVDQIPTNVTDCPQGQLADVYRVCKQMHAVCKVENGVGLSAVQVGIPWRLFVIGQDDGPYRNFLNCTYRQVAPVTFESVEGCLSIKGPDGQLRYFKVERFEEIELLGRELVDDGVGLKLMQFTAKLQGATLLNVIFQHEIDHQNGVLISDIGKEFSLEAYTHV